MTTRFEPPATAPTPVAREQAHDLKNLVAMIGGLVTLAGRDDRPTDAMLRALKERVSALGMAKAAYIGSQGEGAPTYGRILHAALGGDAGAATLRLDIDERPIPPDHVTPIAILAHELAARAGDAASERVLTLRAGAGRPLRVALGRGRRPRLCHARAGWPFRHADIQCRGTAWRHARAIRALRALAATHRLYRLTRLSPPSGGDRRGRSSGSRNPSR